MRRRAQPERDLAAEQRRREFDAAVAAARADLDAMRPHARAVTADAPGPDVAALVAAELDRRHREQAEAAAQAEVDRLACPDGTGCRRCGVSHMGQFVPGPSGGYGTDVEAGWERDGDGWRCAQCTIDYWPLVGATDLDRRVEAIFDRLGGPIPFAAYAHPEQFEGVSVWFCEHPGARTSMTPWAWLDVDRLRANVDAVLHPPVAPRVYAKRERCESCGRRDMWTQIEVTMPDGGVFQVWRCAVCLVRQPWSDAGRQAMA